MSHQRAIDEISALITRSGMSFTISPIAEDFMYALFKAEGKKTGNPEFDPSLHEFGVQNSFWIGCRERSGELVGTVAARLVQADNFIETCRSYRLWYGDKIHVTEPLDIVFNSYDRLPTHSASFIGAGWVRPDWRGHGISWALTRLANYLAVERWRPDWVIGMAISGVAQANVPTVNFGFPRSDLFADGFCVPGFSRQKLFLLTMTRAEASDIALADCDFLSCQPYLKLDPDFGDSLRVQRHVRNDNAPMELAIRAVG